MSVGQMAFDPKSRSQFKNVEFWYDATIVSDEGRAAANVTQAALVIQIGGSYKMGMFHPVANIIKLFTAVSYTFS